MYSVVLVVVVKRGGIGIGVGRGEKMGVIRKKYMFGFGVKF